MYAFLELHMGMGYHLLSRLTPALLLVHLNNLEGKIAVRLYLHTEDDIARVLQQIPGTLTSRTGALQIHQLCITQDGQMSTRKMPADPPRPLRINVRVRSNAAAAATAPEVSRDAELQDSPDLIPEQ